jgi:hypothetical protein
MTALLRNLDNLGRLTELISAFSRDGLLNQGVGRSCDC